MLEKQLTWLCELQEQHGFDDDTFLELTQASLNMDGTDWGDHVLGVLEEKGYEV